jgi:hypothetical protein
MGTYCRKKHPAVLLEDSGNAPDNVPVIVHIKHYYISKKKVACQEVCRMNFAPKNPRM